MRDTTAQTRFESVSKHSNDSLLARGNTLRCDEDRIKLNILIELCTNLQSRVLELEKTKTTQQNVIDSLKRRVKKLERRNRSRTHKLKKLYKVGGEEVFVIEQTEKVVKEVKRNKNFAAKRAEEKRNKPRTQAQKGKIMYTYLKNMEGYKLKQLKSFEFDKIQEMFDRAFKRVNTFKPIRSELVERKQKRVGEELVQERTKKQKVEDDKETTELKQLMKIIPNKEELAINAIPLAVMSPKIVD
nr:hypothetical protein [Tanacetum cinerariifolium]